MCIKCNSNPLLALDHSIRIIEIGGTLRWLFFDLFKREFLTTERIKTS